MPGSPVPAAGRNWEGQRGSPLCTVTPLVASAVDKGQAALCPATDPCLFTSEAPSGAWLASSALYLQCAPRSENGVPRGSLFRGAQKVLSRLQVPSCPPPHHALVQASLSFLAFTFFTPGSVSHQPAGLGFPCQDPRVGVTLSCVHSMMWRVPHRQA